jgi:excisionase family DNA binding protein
MTLLTVNDMASRLQVKDKTLYAWVSQGKIPYVKLNGVIRFDPGEIEQWLQQCHVPIDPPRMRVTHNRSGSATDVDHLIERAKRAVYTAHGETRPIASPSGKEARNGAR